MAKRKKESPLTRLWWRNSTSIDLWTAGCVQTYIEGGMTKRELKKQLAHSRKEASAMIKHMDKMLALLEECPPRVIKDDAE